MHFCQNLPEIPGAHLHTLYVQTLWSLYTAQQNTTPLCGCAVPHKIVGHIHQQRPPHNHGMPQANYGFPPTSASVHCFCSPQTCAATIKLAKKYFRPDHHPKHLLEHSATKRLKSRRLFARATSD